MIKIKTLIVDDESKSRLVLRTLIRNNFPEIELIGEASNVNEAYDLIRQQKPQLVFLDIQMPHADGFSLLKRFESVPFEVVFVTSFDHYAITAIKFSALDYLLKPVEVIDLIPVVKKVVEQIEKKQENQPQIINLLKNFDDLDKTCHVAVHVADSVRIIKETSIVSISAEGNYCFIHTDEGERFTTARNLRDFELYFGSESSFARINKSLMINTKMIVKYSKGEPCMIEMVNNEIFEVSRRRKPQVLEKLKKA